MKKPEISSVALGAVLIWMVLSSGSGLFAGIPEGTFLAVYARPHVKFDYLRSDDLALAKEEPAFAILLDDVVAYIPKSNLRSQDEHAVVLTDTAARKIEKAVSEKWPIIVFSDGKPTYSARFSSIMQSVWYGEVSFFVGVDSAEKNVLYVHRTTVDPQRKKLPDPRLGNQLVEWLTKEKKIGVWGKK